jgi:hypothetical protein
MYELHVRHTLTSYIHLSGPSWETSTSTLLQVLVSIQAMILCDEPWYNEPGREMSYSRDATSGPSKAYNQTLRQHVRELYVRILCETYTDFVHSPLDCAGCNAGMA